MRVLLLSRYDRRGASSRIRFYQYLPFLRAQGWSVDVFPLLGNEYLEELYSRGRKSLSRLAIGSLSRLRRLAASRRYDLLWIEGELLPWFPAWIEAGLRRLGVPYVVDYDDAVFHRYDMHSRSVVRRLLGSKIDQVMRNAALVCAGNEYLMDRAREAGARRVEYLPSVVDLEQYPPASAGAAAGSPFTVGWIGSPVTGQYLRRIAPALRSVAEESPVRLLLVGANVQVADAVTVEARPWSEATESRDIGEFDVGVMPLDDGPWERGKCGFKLVQYMARGVPVIASPVGVNGYLVREGENGFLARTTEEWVRALTALRADPDLRRQMGMAGRARVEQELSVQVAAPRLLSLMEAAARTPAGAA